MKKHLGVTKFLEKDVPQHLDSVILIHAAISNRRRRSRKIFRFAAAATLLISLAGVGTSWLFERNEMRQMTRSVNYSRAELLAMNDFTSLEQENYAVGSITSAEESMFDTYI